MDKINKQLVLGMILAFLFMSSNSFAYDFEVDGLCYNILSGNQVEVTYRAPQDGSYSGNLVIPEKVIYGGLDYNVVAIGNLAFYGCKNLTGTLIIPNTITSIGYDAFANCEGLTGSLVIPNSVTYIGGQAFAYCKGLNGTLTLPNSITSIEQESFVGCTGLMGTLTIPNTVKAIERGAFSMCAGFTGSLIIPVSVTSIGEFAFCRCDGFSGSLTIPNSVTSIGRSAFAGCKRFSGSLVIPNSVTNIEEYAFDCCEGFNGSLIIPNSVTSIGDYAFQSCIGFSDLSIPQNIISIGNGSFNYCRNLILVKSYIENPFNINAFNGISSSAKLEVPIGTKSKYQALSGWTQNFKEIVEMNINPITYTLSITASGNGSASYSGTTIREKTSSFTVNEGTSPTITFSPDNGYRIKNVKVNGSIVTIINNQYTLSSIRQNTTVEVEYTLINTGDIFEADGLFYKILSSDQVEITQNSKYQEYSGELRIPETVKCNGNEYVVVSIGRSAFNECKGFNGALTIPNSVTSIGWAAFYGCSGFTGSLTIPNSVTTIDGYAFMDCSGFSGSLTISNSITSIEERTFLGCSGFTGSLTIPNSVTSIGLYAFYDCSGFTGPLKIPNSVISIKKCAFAKCSGFNGSLTIPNSVTSIDVSVFSGCSHFTGSLIIPNSVTSIGDFAFSSCRGFNGSLILSNSVKTIGEGAFLGCGFTGSLTIPNSVISIGESAFMSCNGIIGSLTIPSSVASIGENAFFYCTNLNGPLTIPNSVISIGDRAFVGCTQLKKVISEIKDPFSIDNTVFKLDSELHETLVVPKGTKNKYQALSGWASYFKEIVEMDDNPKTYTLSISTSGNGSAAYDGVSIKDETKSFTVAEGGNATITLSPDDGYKVNIAKIEGNYSSNLNDNTLTISNIKSNLTVEIEFIAIPSYTLSIKALGNGSVSYDGAVIRDKTSSFTVKKGTSAKITFTPDEGYQINMVKVNGSTVSVNNNEYTISSISKNTTVEVEFVEQLTSFEYEGVNYNIVSRTDRIVYVAAGDYGKVLEVPWHVYYQDMGWYVDGVENGAFDSNPDLAAIIWHPDTTFKGQVSNPNLLLYVSKEHFAPNNIKNVVVNGTANNITLTDAASGNNFYCPQEFTAKTINYTHHYNMETGLGNARGWETIALPFDVQKVTHESKGEIIPFANWRSGDAKKPFWLMQLSGSGWTMATSIKANTPYIISMPNNQQYIAGFLLNGRVTFSSENVNVPKTENLTIANYSDRTFVPSFSSMEKSNDVLALNVVNDIERVTGGSIEGSTFERNLRPVHPFEAYMTSTSSTRSIGIDEGMATGIIELISALSDEGVLRIYNLNGQLVKIEEGRSLDEVMKSLPAGVYVVNGKKVIIK